MLRSFRALRLPSAALLTLAFAATCLSLPSALAEDPVGADAVSRERLGPMLAAGDEGMIVATFKRRPGSTLPFIDSYLEGGLALIEKGAKEGKDATAEATQSFRMGVRFAKLADQAFGGTDFSDYANAFASWSPSEQKAFREGQRLFREGMKVMKGEKPDPAKAIESLERSLRLAEGLNDTWGQAMAQGALADVQFARYEAMKTASGADAKASDAADSLLVRADQAARAAVTLNRKVRLDEDRVGALLTMAKTAKALGGRSEARAVPLQEAWALVRRDMSMSAELRGTVADALIQAFDEMKRPDAADEVRRELAALAAEGKSAAE